MSCSLCLFRSLAAPTLLLCLFIAPPLLESCIEGDLTSQRIADATTAAMFDGRRELSAPAPRWHGSSQSGGGGAHVCSALLLLLLLLL